MAGRLARGDTRLYRFSPPDKERPVVVLTRDTAVGYLSPVIVAPVTSTVRSVPSEVLLDEADGMKGRCVVNLHSIATVSQRHLGRRVAQLGPSRMSQVCSALRFALGCDGQ